jgi:hypothetical protein
MAKVIRPGDEQVLVALDPEALLQAGSNPQSFEPIRLAVPEIASAVYVRRLNASELDDYGVELKAADDNMTRALILSWAIGDKNGKRVYVTDSQIGKLKLFHAKAGGRIIEAFQRANGLIPDEVEKK